VGASQQIWSRDTLASTQDEATVLAPAVGPSPEEWAAEPGPEEDCKAAWCVSSFS